MQYMARYAFSPEKLKDIRNLDDCFDHWIMSYWEGLSYEEDEVESSQDSFGTFIHPRELAQDWQLPFYLDAAVECMYKSLFASGSKYIRHILQATNYVHLRKNILESWNSVKLSV